MCEGSHPIKRRTFLEGMFVAGAAAASGSYLWHNRGAGVSAVQAGELASMPERHMTKQQVAERVHLEIARDEVGISLDEMVRATKPDMNLEHLERLSDELRSASQAERHLATLTRAREAAAQRVEEGLGLADLNTNRDPRELAAEFEGDYFDRVRFFDNNFTTDIHLSDAEWDTMLGVSHRIEAVRNYVGYGNFNIISWDDMLAYARNVGEIGRFNEAEVAFLEELFYGDARELGFYGERTSDQIATVVPRTDVEKIPRTGHFLLRGESLELYNRLRDDIGDTLILTSGIRGIPKQFDLFLAKMRQTEGNVSRASRSIAPPGYSYHSVGDFDVGKYGLGLGNFTEEFAQTQVFDQLKNSGYTDIRYTADNRFGVRFEPWHVRVG